MSLKAKQRQNVGGTNQLINTFLASASGETKSPYKSYADKRRPKNGKD